jgi:hypothetical protein
VALVVMLGTLLKRLGPAAGIALIVLILMFVPPTGFGWSRYLPGMLVNWVRPTELTPLAEFALGNPLAPLEALWVTAVCVVVFTAVAVGAFRRAEL